MEWFILFIVIAIGLTLVLLEFLVFPGTGIAGIIGFGCICAAVFLGYRFFGTPGGHYFLLGMAVLCLGITVYALRSKTWKRLSLSATIDGSVEGVDESVIHAGDTGRTVGRLAPMGKVKVGEHIVEAESQSGYVDSNTEVEVIKVFKDKIIVKLKI